MEPGSNCSSVDAQSLPKSMDVSKFQDGVMPARRLHRGLSGAVINSNIVAMTRDVLQKGAEAAMIGERGDGEDGKPFIQTTEFTFVLPDLSCYPEDFKAFLYKDLIDTSTLVTLEQTGHLNWWTDIGACHRLLPMVTSGDGNCLLHAASLGMWGLHDRQLILRKLLCDALMNGSSAEALKRRWRYQQSTSYRQFNLVLNEEEWESDWGFLLKLSSPHPRSVGTRRQSNSLPRAEHLFPGQEQEQEAVYESLEEIHVFALAHILRRPIIVVAKSILEDVHGDALAPIPFGGIYLPLEWDAQECHSAPLLLTYDLSHFCALVAMEVSSPATQKSNAAPLLADAIPLVSTHLELLPVHFAIDPGPHYDFNKNLDFSLSHHEKMKLIQNYFVVEQIPIPHFQRELDSYPEVLGAAGMVKSAPEESGGSAKDQNYGDDFDKKSTAKPVKFTTTPFDAIGSKLKNIARNKKAGKLDRRGSIGVVTQSTRTSSVAVETFENQSFVVSARLHQRKTRYQDVMVRNYVDSMREKFDAQQIRRREQNEEIRRLSIERFNIQLKTECGDHSLCDATLRADVPLSECDLSEISAHQGQSHVLSNSNTGSQQREGVAVVAGNSKFYAAAAKKQCPTIDRSVESKKPDDTFKNESGIGKTVAEKGIPKSNKLDLMRLETALELSEKGDGIDSESLPQRAKVDGSNFKRAPRRINAITKRAIPDRHTVDGNDFKIVSKPSSENRATRFVADVLTSPRNRPESKNSASGVLNHELNRDVVVGETQQPLCRAGGCSFYGAYETDFLCSRCFKSGKMSRCFKLSE